MYFLFLLIAYVFVYILGILWFQLFAWNKPKIQVSALYIVSIWVSFFMILFLVSFITNPEYANRVQHALWGWFIMTYISYLSYKSSWVKFSGFVLFHVFLFIATAFWVLNELLESIWQLQYWLIFSQNLPDTWFDLWANTFGAILWAGIFTFIARNKNL